LTTSLSTQNGPFELETILPAGLLMLRKQNQNLEKQPQNLGKHITESRPTGIQDKQSCIKNVKISFSYISLKPEVMPISYVYTKHTVNTK